MYLLDTNAIIYYLKEENDVVSIIEDIYTQNAPVYVSAITEAELFAFSGMSDDEIESIEKFLQSVSIIPMAPGSLIFKAVRQKRDKALYTPLRRSPTSPEYAVGAGSVSPNVYRSVAALP